jgi:3-hydroxyacyl-CoA dehydrogenase
VALVDLDKRDSTAILRLDNPPVNALTRALRGAILAQLARANADPEVEAVILVGAHRSFIAGADIREFDISLEPPQTPQVIDAIEASAKPVIAAMAGNALGGGLEVALACDARIAADDAVLGCPEILLGLLPGAGGTQRLPRIVGIERALELMITGKRIPAREAAALGIVDDVVDAEVLLDVALRRAQQLAASTRRARVRDRSVAAPASGYFDDYRASLATRARNQIAQMAIVQSVENAVTLPFDEAVAAERALFLECLSSPQSKAMRYAFFAERRAGKHRLSSGSTDHIAVSRIAVVGAGTMGTEIAYCCLAAGYEVVLHDIERANLERAGDRIAQLGARGLERGRLSPEGRRFIDEHLEPTTELADVASTDLVIEAVFEELARKQALFAELDSLCREDVLLATNTSTLDVAAIAGSTRRPDAVLGLHFFSPASAMRLIEIVRAERTGDRAIAAALAIAQRLGKIGVVVGNGHGFVGNRMFHAYQREAQALLLEGAAPEQVDRVLQSWGMAMGPIAVGDLAGLDVGYRIRREAPARPDDPTWFRVADCLVEAGRLGQKTGRGHYRYAEGSRVPEADPEVTAMIEAEATRFGIDRRPVDDAEILERCTLALVIEGICVLESGIARCASDIDVIWLNGYGFPRYRGGPMHYAEACGLADVLERLRRLERRRGARDWSPPAMLVALVEQNLTLSDYQAPGSDVPPL